MITNLLCPDSYRDYLRFSAEIFISFFLMMMALILRTSFVMILLTHQYFFFTLKLPPTLEDNKINTFAKVLNNN
ncbi:MAG: hypothetical protein DRI89_09125 [Bacteroidetes bacterium]|nr:MAG: hypothetical protein DRI89_09125 [Bacteroidota bacterium]